MSTSDTARALAEELGRIAPEIDFAATDPDEDLRDAFEIDSMDFLTLVTALSKRLGLDIPEADYPKLGTISDAVTYLEARAGAGSGAGA
jgi:acyl carrier protein